MKELEAVHRQAEKDRMAARSLGVTDVISSGAQPLPPGLGPRAFGDIRKTISRQARSGQA